MSGRYVSEKVEAMACDTRDTTKRETKSEARCSLARVDPRRRGSLLFTLEPR